MRTMSQKLKIKVNNTYTYGILKIVSSDSFGMGED